MDRQTDRRTDRQMNRRTDRITDICDSTVAFATEKQPKNCNIGFVKQHPKKFSEPFAIGEPLLNFFSEIGPKG